MFCQLCCVRWSVWSQYTVETDCYAVDAGALASVCSGMNDKRQRSITMFDDHVFDDHVICIVCSPTGPEHADNTAGTQCPMT